MSEGGSLASRSTCICDSSCGTVPRAPKFQPPLTVAARGRRPCMITVSSGWQVPHRPLSERKPRGWPATPRCSRTQCVSTSSGVTSTSSSVTLCGTSRCTSASESVVSISLDAAFSRISRSASTSLIRRISLFEASSCWMKPPSFSRVAAANQEATPGTSVLIAKVGQAPAEGGEAAFFQIAKTMCANFDQSQ